MEIHTSERGQFHRCKNLWRYTSPNILNLEPNRPPAPLEFGTGIHVALAAYYDPATPREPDVALAAWNRFCMEQRKFYENSVGKLITDNDEAIAEFDERSELGRGMLLHYTTVWSPYNDEPLECVWVEKAFTLRVKPRSPHTYSFKPDALFRDHSRDGAYVLGEWKTAAQVYDTEEWLQLDSQNGSYLWGMKRALGIDIDYVAYTTLWKEVPKPLRMVQGTKELKGMGEVPSRDLRQVTTYDIAMKQLNEFFAGHIPPAYDDLLAKLGSEGNRFFKRTIVRRNRNEIANIGRTIEIETAEMNRLRLHPELITRSPSKFNCDGCAFRQPCIARGEGSDEEGMLLSTLFRKRESA